MQSRFPLLALVFILAAGPAQAADDAGSEERPGFLGRVTRSLNPFRPREPKDKLNEGKAPNWKRLELTMVLEPLPLKLPETRTLKVRVQLTNKSRKFVQMEFPTAQRIEVLVRTRDGKLVEQWSEDQSFANEPSLVVINPSERLEYVASVATRDMSPGETYIIEAFFPNYEPLRTRKSVVPEK
jgi:hypothetical protein